MRLWGTFIVKIYIIHYRINHNWRFILSYIFQCIFAALLTPFFDLLHFVVFLNFYYWYQSAMCIPQEKYLLLELHIRLLTRLNDSMDTGRWMVNDAFICLSFIPANFTSLFLQSHHSTLLLGHRDTYAVFTFTINKTCVHFSKRTKLCTSVHNTYMNSSWWWWYFISYIVVNVQQVPKQVYQIISTIIK